MGQWFCLGHCDTEGIGSLTVILFTFQTGMGACSVRNVESVVPVGEAED